MKILKYILLLFLLGFIALSVFVATQKGDYSIISSKVIKASKPGVFNYVNEYRNWENWWAWNDNKDSIHFSYPKQTTGNGASYSWSNKDEKGNIKTSFVKENDSIVQKMILNDSKSTIYWSFKDTIGGTKVTSKMVGTIPFLLKVYAFTSGGIESVVRDLNEKSLLNLDKTLDFEINYSNIKVNGIVTKLGGYYLEQTINSTFLNRSKNSKIMMSNLSTFCKNNNLPINGKPFIIYNSYDTTKQITNFSVGIPIKNQIFTSEGSDLTCKSLAPFQAVKTTLKGDYSHHKKAWDQTMDYVYKNKYIKNTAIPLLEVYNISSDQEKRPSKWITTIYIAVHPKNSAVKPKKRVTENKTSDSTKTRTKKDTI
jgi:hypothetical protein